MSSAAQVILSCLARIMLVPSPCGPVRLAGRGELADRLRGGRQLPRRHQMVPALYLFLGGMRVLDAMLGDVPVESEPGNEQLEDAFPHRIAGEQPPRCEE